MRFIQFFDTNKCPHFINISNIAYVCQLDEDEELTVIELITKETIVVPMCYDDVKHFINEKLK